ncbi:flagellar filament capping protein FliD [Clostridium sp. D53t1_180928_C8]|uniref:flagellar filament capping protein FliD n=1 Tax=Clostridium sp. D53t1_180928_C8 TaxID=2787101 RepID=UPI0018A91FD0|nr:flagellar filament capping protein FliD [Clostridium sp. D53t1_180928_C8]
MTTINSNRITGLATGMDIDETVKNMLTGEQNKINKAEQKKQTQKWQQESYRDIIKDVKGLYDKYFTATSVDNILSSKVFATVNVSSSDNNIISAVAGAGAENIYYNFQVNNIAEAPRMVSNTTKELTRSTKLSELGLESIINDKGEELAKEISFKFNYGKDKNTKVITINSDDTIESLTNKINDASNSEIKASFSQMTGKFTVESKMTGEISTLKVIDVEKGIDGSFIDSNTESSGALLFLGINGLETSGHNSEVIVKDSIGNEIKRLKEAKNTFTIDYITYELHGTSKSDKDVILTSIKDTKSTSNKVKAFIEEYNKVIDNIYGLVTEKKNNDYAPLTKAQKEEMTEEEIEKWEKKAKVGILRNDSELRRFIDEIKGSVYGKIGDSGINLSDIGITSTSDYNKPGQLSLDEEKFAKALAEKGNLVYRVTTGAFEKIKKATYSYAGSSDSIFAKKAGIDKTSTATNNLYSEQIRKQEEYIKELTTRMQKKQEALYLKFSNLESSMNTLNSQMNYLVSSLS